MNVNAITNGHREEAENKIQELYDNRQTERPPALRKLYEKRVRQNRDLVILVTDSSNDRGTGKTTLALQLADWMDRTDEGMTTEKVTLDPHPLTEAYIDQPHGSGLVLDETEVGMDKYRAGSATNSAIRELVATGRVMQKYLVLNAPGDHLVDGDLKTLVDVWVLVDERGLGYVYRMDWNPHGGHKLTHDMGEITWGAISSGTGLHDVYEYLAEKKQERLRGEESDRYIQRSEAQEMVNQAREDAREGTRNKYLLRMAEAGHTHAEMADIVDLSRSRVSQLLTELR